MQCLRALRGATVSLAVSEVPGLPIAERIDDQSSCRCVSTIHTSFGLDLRELTDGAALHDMGDESLVGIVNLMTGEKDPRNLMLVFSILKVVMVEWDVSNHAEVCIACGVVVVF